jgi:dihydroorotase
VFSAHAAIELYAEAFESAGRLDRLQAFASERGPDFYKLPRNTTKITLKRTAWTPPAVYRFGNDELTPFRAGESVAWQLAEEVPS